MLQIWKTGAAHPGVQIHGGTDRIYPEDENSFGQGLRAGDGPRWLAPRA